MARNYKPRSASSASSKREYRPERAHVRAPRQVGSATPRVFGSPSEAENPSASGSGRIPRHGAPKTSNRTGRVPQTGAHGASGSGAARGGYGERGAARGSANGGPRSARGAAQNSRTRRGTARSGTARQGNARGGDSRSSDGRKAASSQRRSTPRRKAGLGIKLIVAGVAIVLLTGGFAALYYSSLFPITDVRVAGNDKLRSEYIIGLAEVPDDSTFLRTDVEGIRTRLLAEPWIKTVDVERGFPGTLTLRITEQSIAAVADIVPERATESVQQWVISDDGTWLSAITAAVDNPSSNNAGNNTAGGDTNPPATSEDAGDTGADQTATGDATDPAATGDATDPAAGADAGDGGTDATGDDATGAPASGTNAPPADDTASGSSNGAGTNSELRVQINPEELAALPKIRDVSPAVRPVAGVQETDEGITNALALLKGFSKEMRGMVASISAPDKVKTTLYLYNNVGVAFGVAEDIEAKERAIATLLAEHEGTITFINVRVADRASYRATE